METTARYLWVGLFTLAVMLAGFGSVYWLHHNAGLTARTYYQVHFAGPVSGLQTGAAVQFNGVRVGEVTSLSLDDADPTKVIAGIAISPGTPVRADTFVGIDFPGLTGAPEISLRGGTPTAPALHGSEANPPVLTADASAGQDVMQAARMALQRLNKILADNSGRIDAILGGLEHFVGGNGKDKPKPVYDLTLAPPSAGQGSAHLRVQLVVAEPTASVTLQTQRMLSRSKDGEIMPIGEAQWSDSLPKLIQEKIIQAYDDRGLAASVLPPLDNATGATYQLITDIRDFTVIGDAEPMAHLVFSMKIVADDGHVVGAQIFQESVPLKGSDPQDLVAGFDQALDQVVSKFVGWTSKALAS